MAVSSTSYIEQQRQLEGLLGERFIDLRWRPGDREEMAFKAATNNPYLDNIRDQLAVDVLSLMCRVEELTASFAGLFISHIIHPNPIIPLTKSVKFEDSLRLYRNISNS